MTLSTFWLCEKNGFAIFSIACHQYLSKIYSRNQTKDVWLIPSP